MTSQAAAYHTLLGMVWDSLPEDTVAQAIKAGLKVKVQTLQNIRRGITHNLPVLIKMVRIAMPDQEIPEYIVQASKKSNS